MSSMSVNPQQQQQPPQPSSEVGDELEEGELLDATALSALRCVRRAAFEEEPPDHPQSLKHDSHTSDSDISATLVDCCCSRLCIQNFSATEVRILRHQYHDRPSEQSKLTWLMSVLREHSGQLPGAVGLQAVCQQAFLWLYGFSTTKLNRARQLIDGDGVLPPPHRNLSNPALQHDAPSIHCWSWLDVHLRQVCDIFVDSGGHEIWALPTNTKQRELFEDYLGDCGTDDRHAEFSTFARVLRERFSQVKFHPRTDLPTCETCIRLRHGCRAASVSEAGRARCLRELKEHSALHKRERAYIARCEQLAATQPLQFGFLMLDESPGRSLPHFSPTIKGLSNLVDKGSITIGFEGAYIGGELEERILFLLPYDLLQFKKDANMACTLLFLLLSRLIQRNGSNAPLHVTIVCDNGSEYKNQWTLALLSLLVQLGWFQSLEFVMNLAGHTHGRVDAQHGLVKRALAKQSYGTLGDLVRTVTRGFPNQASAISMTFVEQVLDWKLYFQPAMGRLSGHFTPHQFRVFLDPQSRQAFLQTRSTSATEWTSSAIGEPGVRLFDAAMLTNELREVQTVELHAADVRAAAREVARYLEPVQLQWFEHVANAGRITFDDWTGKETNMLPGIGRLVSVSHDPTSAPLRAVRFQTVEFCVSPARLQRVFPRAVQVVEDKRTTEASAMIDASAAIKVAIPISWRDKAVAVDRLQAERDAAVVDTAAARASAMTERDKAQQWREFGLNALASANAWKEEAESRAKQQQQQQQQQLVYPTSVFMNPPLSTIIDRPAIGTAAHVAAPQSPPPFQLQPTGSAPHAAATGGSSITARLPTTTFNPTTASRSRSRRHASPTAEERTRRSSDRSRTPQRGWQGDST